MAEKRAIFVQAQPGLDPARLVFVDESGFRLGSAPRHGWAPKGEDSPGYGVFGKWQTITMIGAIALDGFRGLMTIDAGTSNEVFEAFVRHQLIVNLLPGDIVVMDNLSAHKNAHVRSLIQNVGCDILYTPPYSPEFNPIEEAWAKIKDIIRRLENKTRNAFDNALACAADLIHLNDIKSWVLHAGYRLTSS